MLDNGRIFKKKMVLSPVKHNNRIIISVKIIIFFSDNHLVKQIFVDKIINNYNAIWKYNVIRQEGYKVFQVRQTEGEVR